MSTEEVQASPIVKVARDLTEIIAMTDHLDDQAEHKHSMRIDGTVLPGGLAMVAMADVANHEAWTNQYQGREHWNALHANDPAKRVDLSHIEDEDDEWEPPLQTLCFWSEQWRRQHGAEYDRRPTVNSEANFLRFLLEWAWDNEERWDAFAKDIRDARVRLENVLYAGKRAERSRIVCDRCDDPRRLVKVYALREAEATECTQCGNIEATDLADQDCPACEVGVLETVWQSNEDDDRHKCPSCKARFDSDDLRRAHAKQLRSEGAERWLHQADAIGLLKMQDRSERTVRKWLKEGEGAGYCDPKTHEVWVWWPDLWRRHLVTPTRKRASA